uniref:KINETOCHORE PROTEIN HEC1, KINETOCHORE PROTEIN SPC25 n=1 Tax=Homo sapiens TaxID=9606 RepID=UPI000181CFD2|nr:Chain A, KINETOCHORE PROTEIN HEC1, KINETOCHORE PROTEIN SPC25 [Homo sapiens]2VE7_B Chain B, KINETOCHORE PROTEIN HEC1, KINETOCHORE PROTEIN SPC25 [Homo sapiens]3IZ0_C Chain C, NDC80-SPC25 chimera protein, Chain B from PDB 2VE7 (Ndc80 bonsai) [Homo sapiens]3IZ0_E Chain E, NDC80-SPC25 chimera protein, Chain B from PDB 2VE7 (Ndc80 bonsai) [Homo sapiens]
MIKDPRPLNDKAFIQQCIRQLCEFLTENGYAHNVSMKSLQAPSVKDFLKIFTFLYGFLCPSYELPDTKFEEEVPRIFKDLGYPFALSKSSMYTVGAPHTWPHIVAALVWLIDCIKIHTAMKESSPLFDDGQPWGEETEDGIMHNKLFLDYTIKCYESFMSGADSFDEMNAELQSKLKDLFNVDAFKLESLEAKNRALNEQIARLEQERSTANKANAERLKRLQKSADLYKDRLGLEIRKIYGEKLQFIFTNIDPKNPESPFMFSLHLNEARDYEVSDSAPHLEGLAEFQENVRKTNNFSAFLANVRKAFTATVYQ